MHKSRMLSATARAKSNLDTGVRVKTAAMAWVVAAVFYFYQYALRSAPSVMMPQLSDAFGITAVSVASIVTLFYYGYSFFSLVAGLGMDRLGPRKVLPIAAAVTGIGAMLFATGNNQAGSIGRLLQGTGGAFAAVGALYIATTNFSPSQAATLVGATQMFGMAGGTAGQFIVGPLIHKGLAWDHFWVGMGIAGFAMSGLLLMVLPEKGKSEAKYESRSTIGAFSTVFRNPQTILCGLIAGLLFIPTTIFDMIWGVRYLQEAHGFDYASAVMRSSTIPLGWIIGAPLMGFFSDRLGRRKPVIITAAVVLLACLGSILFGEAGDFPPYIVGLLAGVASGAAMLPYTIVKEINPPQFGGVATGVINFLNFTFSALLGPVFSWALQYLSRETGSMQLAHYRMAFAPLLLGVATAIVLTLFLAETGPAVRRQCSVTK